MAAHLVEHFRGENTSQCNLANNCYKVYKTNKILPISRSNGYYYPPKPIDLPQLDPIT